jgi:hypothetical protein
MRLTGTDGQSLNLEILGYQFPDPRPDEYDSNWLRIKGAGACSRGHWTFVDPCLLTFEVAALADWLECVASGGSCSSEITFIEPNLSFHQQSGALRVYFELEARPAWAASKEAPAEDLWLDFPASTEMLRVGAMALRHQLQRFPRRWASD